VCLSAARGTLVGIINTAMLIACPFACLGAPLPFPLPYQISYKVGPSVSSLTHRFRDLEVTQLTPGRYNRMVIPWPPDPKFNALCLGRQLPTGIRVNQEQEQSPFSDSDFGSWPGPLFQMKYHERSNYHDHIFKILKYLKPCQAFTVL
jgi:hypothetical protein